MLVGYVYKQDDVLQQRSDQISLICVYVLLVLMGMSTSQNEEFIQIFTDSGKISILLALFGMLGSIVCTLPVYLFLKKKKKNVWGFLSLYSVSDTTKSDAQDTAPPAPKLELKINSSPPSEKLFKKDFFYPLFCFIVGILLNLYILKINSDSLDNLVLYTLYGLLFFTGIGIGKLNIIDLFRRYHVLIIIIPFLALLGSLLGAVLVNYAFDFSRLRECLSINAGMSYYSISSVINKTYLGDQVGLIALLTNLIRETATMLFCYSLVRIFGPLAPISTGGASTMDTTLPFIRRNTSSEYSLIAFFNGVILTIVVPPLTTFIANF